VSTDRTVGIVAAAVFLVAFAVYLVTLAPTVFLIDSGLLTVAAATRGSAHPPGFPLFLILTHLATLLPVGTVAWRTNLASAFFAALASAGAAVVVAEILLTATLRPATPRKPAKKEPPPTPPPPPAAIAAAMATGGLLLAFSRTLWAYATVTEVYALNTFLICALLALVLRWRRTRSTRSLYAGAALAGASLGVHYLTFGFALLGVLVLVLWSGGLPLVRSRQFWIATALALLSTTAVYAYLPFAARGNPPLNWGDPDDARDLWEHVTAKVYRSYITAEEGGDQVGELRRLVFRDLGPAVLPAALVLAAIGLATLFRRDRALFVSWVVIAVATASWFAVYPITDDGDAYLLPLFVVLVTAAGFGAGVIARNRTAVGWLMLAIPAIALAAHWRDRDRSDLRIGRTYGEDALRGIAPDSILLTNDGQLWGSLMYLREAEHVRRDVVTIHHGSLVRSWYVEQFMQQQPQLAASVRKELDAYRPLVEIFENDQPRWNADPQVREGFVGAFNDLIVALMSRQIARGGHVYATAELALKDFGAGGRITPYIRETYDLVPGGLALEVLPKSGPRQIRVVPFELGALENAQTRRTGGPVIAGDIIPGYVGALQMRARYLAATSRFEEAKASYDAALRIDPENAEVRSEREQLDRLPAQ
jgi:tetratricopeptide (TPR) repeat protein